MANLVVTNAIPGLTVYGEQQYEYTVGGESGKDLGYALSAAAIKQSTDVEKAARAFGSLVRMRARKVNDLGRALAIISGALGSLKNKGSSGDKAYYNDLGEAQRLLGKYGIGLDCPYDSSKGYYCTRGNLMKKKPEVQYQIDSENNSLQQDNVSLQGLMNKRNSSFSTAGKIVNKFNTTAGNVIKNFGV